MTPCHECGPAVNDTICNGSARELYSAVDPAHSHHVLFFKDQINFTFCSRSVISNSTKVKMINRRLQFLFLDSRLNCRCSIAVGSDPMTSDSGPCICLEQYGARVQMCMDVRGRAGTSDGWYQPNCTAGFFAACTSNLHGLANR